MRPACSLERRFDGFGTSFEVRASDADLLRRAVCSARALGWRDGGDSGVDLTYVLSRCRSQDARMPSSFDLRCDDALIHRTIACDELVDAFENHAKIETADRAKSRLFVHAGVVSWRGHAIVMPGSSRAGKSTLVKALIDAGAQYYSDEFALLDADARVHPYRLPLSMRANGVHAAARIPVEALGPSGGDGPLPIGLVVVTEYRRHARWRPLQLSPGESMLALMEHTVAARRAPDRAMRILRQAALSATAVKSRRGDARATARALLTSVP